MLLNHGKIEKKGNLSKIICVCLYFIAFDNDGKTLICLFDPKYAKCY